VSIGIFAIAGILQAAESNKGIQEGKKAISEGAELTAAEKQMTDGYNMVAKGESMMTASTMKEGQEMVKMAQKCCWRHSKRRPPPLRSME
jgi:hypothetical protein